MHTILKAGVWIFLIIEKVVSWHYHTGFDIFSVLPQINLPEIAVSAAQQSVSCGMKLFIAVSVQVPTRCPYPSAKLTLEALLFTSSDWMEEILPPEITANPLMANNTVTRPILFLALHIPPPFCFPLPLLLACGLAVWWECNPSRLHTEQRIEPVDAGNPCPNASMAL